MPPAAAPMMKHMPTFHHSDGIAPQIDVPTKITADSRIEARRPNRSASQPQSTEPTTVPQRAAKGNQATVSALISYSPRMPGRTKPSVAGFITSITSARVRTTISRQCAGPSGASSGALTVT
jgi:hypothetical protein